MLRLLNTKDLDTINLNINNNQKPVIINRNNISDDRERPTKINIGFEYSALWLLFYYTGNGYVTYCSPFVINSITTYPHFSGSGAWILGVDWHLRTELSIFQVFIRGITKNSITLNRANNKTTVGTNYHADYLSIIAFH